MSSAAPPSGAPPSSFASITLPPGMTLEQFESLQGSLVAIAITVAVAFGVLLWDYVNLFPEEYKLYQASGRNIWRSPASWSFIFVRYSGILATLPSLFLSSVQSNHCQTAIVINQIGVVLVVAFSGIIFCCRVIAIWDGNGGVYALVGAMYLGMLGCWCAVASQYRATTGPHTPFGSNCQMLPTVSWVPTLAYSASIAFDAVIIALTIFKLNGTRTTSSKDRQKINHANVMYFLVTLSGNITVLVIEAVNSRKVDLIKPGAGPFATLITATMGARVFLNLRQSNQRQGGAEKGLPFTSSTSNRGKGNRAFPRAPPPPPPPPIPRVQVSLAPNRGHRPDTPFASYDYDSPRDDKHFGVATITRETVVTVE